MGHDRLQTRLEFTEETVIERSVADVFAYICDLEKAPEWRVGVVRVVTNTSGPLRAGSQMTEWMRLLGRVVVTKAEITDFVPGSRWSFRSVSGAIPVAGEYVCAAANGGTLFTYRLAGELSGVWFLVAPVLRRRAARDMRESLRRLRQRLIAEPEVAGTRTRRSRS